MVSDFGDLSSSAGLQKFNDFLLTRSYVEGYKPSNADLSLFRQVPTSVCKKEFPNVARWFRHIASFSEQAMSSWEGAITEAKPTKAAAPAKAKDSDDDDFDFSDDDSDDEDAAAIIAKKKEEAAAAAKKPQVSGKSSIIMDVKPWGLETDMAELERLVRAIEFEGLRWAGSQLEEVAYGVMKLRINAVVVDDLVGTDDLQEAIEALDEYVQSTDIYAFNKL